MTQMRIRRLPVSSPKESFFVKIHKSIVSPDYYISVKYFPFGRVLLFFVQLCFFTALVGGGAATYHSLNTNKGLPAQISQMLPGMSINNGVFNPGRATPYIPEKSSVAAVFNTLSCMPGFFDSIATSFLVVDTSAVYKPVSKDYPSIVLASRQVVVHTDSTHTLALSYARTLPFAANIAFTPEGVHGFLVHNVIGVLFNFCIQTGMVSTFIFFVSCLFLAFAAYIFRADKRSRFVEYIKTACFAITPLFIGTNLIALSGVTLGNAWEILIVISTILMFRGVRAQLRAGMAGTNSPIEPKE
jgi:hypothetical protein